MLAEVERINGDLKLTGYQRYLALLHLMRDRDRELGGAFGDGRRSYALIHLAHLRKHDLLTDEEYARFSDETRQVMEMLSS